MQQAIIRSGGKQHLVIPGQKLRLERLAGAAGDAVTFQEVLLVADGQRVVVGTPTVAGATVIATLTAQGRGRKVIVQKYKPKVRYRRKRGHRQPFSEVVIQAVNA